jgi:hypothetical protein
MLGRKCPSNKRCVLWILVILLLASPFALAKKHPDPLINLPLVPDTAVPGQGDFTLTVNGTGFEPNSVVKWNGESRATQFVSSSSLQATIRSKDVKKAGTAWVTVVTPGRKKPLLSNVVYFTIRQDFGTVAMTLRNNLSVLGPLAVGDFNGDGKLDVAVGQANGQTGTIQVFLGNGDGTFQTPVITNFNYVPTALVAADFTNDGMDDLAVSYCEDQGYCYYPYTQAFVSTGGGNLQPTGNFPGVVVATGDLNGDGNIDALASQNYECSVFLGNGDGAFQAGQQQIGYGEIGANLAVGDFNGDGFLDFASSDGASVYVFLGNGDGTFPTSGVAYQAQYDGYGIAVADVNGDGKLDIVTNGASVLLGHGDGTFVSAGGVQSGGFSSIAVGDFNGDGIADIAMTALSGNYPYPESFEVLLGNGDGTFQTPISIPTGGCCAVPVTAGFGWGDFNGDGLLDVFVANGSSTYGQPSVPVLLLQTVASASPNNLNFGYQNLNVTTPAQSVIITNVSHSKLKMQAATITGPNAGDFADRTNCNHALLPGASCKVRVTFTPTQAGSRVATLNVNYNGPGGPQAIPLTGTGEALSVSLTPSSLTFPTQLVGTVGGTQDATLTNNGSYQVTVSKILIRPHFHQTNNCPSTLYVNQACQISVRFKPAQEGITNGTLSVKIANGVPTQTVSLSGTGTVVKLSVEGINFGDQEVGTSSAPVPVKMTNKGTTSLSISGITIVGTNAGDFSQVNNCGNSLPAKGSCTIQVTFSPTGTGQRSASLQISDDGGGSPQSVSLTGTGT